MLCWKNDAFLTEECWFVCKTRHFDVDNRDLHVGARGRLHVVLLRYADRRWQGGEHPHIWLVVSRGDVSDTSVWRGLRDTRCDSRWILLAVFHWHSLWFSIGFLLIFIICTTAGTEDYNATCVCIIKSSFFSRNSRYFNRNSGFFNRKSGALRSAMTSKLSPTSRPMWVKMMNFVFKTRNVVFETRNCALNMMYFAGCIAVLGDHYSLHRRLRWYYCVDRCVYYLEIKPFWW